MAAIVQPLTHGSNPDAVPSNNLVEVKEVLIGDGDAIIGSLPDVGPVEAATIFETGYYQTGVALEGADHLGSDIENSDPASGLEPLDPASLYLTLLGKYSESFIDWEPETLNLVIKDDFDLGEIPAVLWDKILATRIAGKGVSWNEWLAFEKSALAVSGSPVYPDVIQSVAPEEMSALFSLMRKIHPDKELSDEVSRYVAARMYADNFLYCGTVFPDNVQALIFELGASRQLVDATHEKVTEIVTRVNAGETSVVTAVALLNNSSLDIQVARYLSLL
jgi:hypothetical protein